MYSSAIVLTFQSLDLARIDRIIRCSLESLQSHGFQSLFNHKGHQALSVEPVPESSVSTYEDRKLADKEAWWKTGLKAINEGKLAVLLLSGGQAREFYLQ